MTAHLSISGDSVPPADWGWQKSSWKDIIPTDWGWKKDKIFTCVPFFYHESNEIAVAHKRIYKEGWFCRKGFSGRALFEWEWGADSNVPPCHGQPHFPFWTFSSVHLFGFSPLSIYLSAVLLVQETPSASFLDARCTLCSWLTRQEGFTFKLHFTRPPFPLCHSFFSDQILPMYFAEWRTWCVCSLPGPVGLFICHHFTTELLLLTKHQKSKRLSESAF